MHTVLKAPVIVPTLACTQLQVTCPAKSILLVPICNVFSILNIDLLTVYVLCLYVLMKYMHSEKHWRIQLFRLLEEKSVVNGLIITNEY